jgi:hypothetical protein
MNRSHHIMHKLQMNSKYCQYSTHRIDTIFFYQCTQFKLIYSTVDLVYYAESESPESELSSRCNGKIYDCRVITADTFLVNFLC